MSDGDDELCSLKWNNYQKNVGSHFVNLMENDSLTDITFACEGKKISAHKLILFGCSPYFEDLLKNDRSHSVFYMKDVKFKIIKLILEYMYLGEVVISTDMLEEFMSTAKSLQIRGLTKSETSEQNKRKQSTSTTDNTKRTKFDENLLVQSTENNPSISTVEEVPEMIPEINLIPECKMDQEIKIEYVELESSPATPDFFCEDLINNSMDNSSINQQPHHAQLPETWTENLLTPLTLPSFFNLQTLAPQTSTSLNLAELLNRTVSGKMLIKNYLKENKLQYSDRNTLCTVIADHWIGCKHQVISSTYREAFVEIKNLFPTEEEEYYISSTKGEIGKLNSRYYSLCRKYQAKGLVESRYTLKKKQPATEKLNQSEVNSNDSQEPTKSEIDAWEWLKLNKTPDSIVFEKWKETYKLRRNQINELNGNFYKNWPLIKEEIGAYLIELDYNMLHPGKVFMSEKLVRFSKDIVPYYNSAIKDESSRKLLKELTSFKNIDTIDYVLVNLLSSVLIPPIIHCVENSIRRSWKPTIFDSQNLILLRIETNSDVQQTINSHRNSLKTKGLTNQPLIIAVGPLENLSQFYVSLDDFLYKVDSFKNALSLAYKIFQVLDIQYPKGVKQVWEFIQAYFFESSLKGKKASQLISLLAYINK